MFLKCPRIFHGPQLVLSLLRVVGQVQQDIPRSIREGPRMLRLHPLRSAGIANHCLNWT
jgi:hypothetical protein